MATFRQVVDPIVAVYYVRVVGLQPLDLVLLGTVVLVAGLLFEVPTGVVADTYSRKISVVIGVALSGVCFVAQGLWPVLSVIVVAEAMRGVGGTFISGALDAWIADEIGPDAAARAYLRFAQVRQLGALLGTIAGTALATVALGLPIAVGGGLILLLAVYLGFAMPERGFRPAVHVGHGGLGAMVETTRQGMRLIRYRPFLLTLIGVWGCLALASEGHDRLWEAHLLRYFQLPTIGDLDAVVWFGVINAGFMVGSVLGTEVVRRRLDVTDNAAVSRALLLFAAVEVAALLVFALAGSFAVAAVAYVCAQSFRRMNGPVFTGWVNRHLDPRYRATVLSMGGQVDALGQLIGGPLVGVVATAASLRAGMVASAALLLPSLPLLVRAGRQVAAEPPSVGPGAGRPVQPPP
jgi:DHA3 family tetracycline resistance protein-like MFS transporter